jgi:hypothetical protein
MIQIPGRQSFAKTSHDGRKVRVRVRVRVWVRVRVRVRVWVRVWVSVTFALSLSLAYCAFRESAMTTSLASLLTLCKLGQH